MSALVIVIEGVPGSVTERDIRENAEALASRLGGRVSTAQPVTPFNTPSISALLRWIVARVHATAA